MDASSMVWFPETAVESLLDPRLLAARVEEAFRDYAAGRLIEMRPARIDDTELASNFVSFHAYWPARALSTTKVLIGAERNPARGLPMIDAVIVATDAATGRIAAMLGARHITAMRTAATTFLALRAMGLRPQSSVGLIGTGVQMRAHALMAAIFGAGRLYVASASDNRDRAGIAAQFLTRETGLSTDVLTADEVAGVSDAVVLSTISAAPVAAARHFRSDGLVASVGAFLPHAAEIDPVIVREAGLVISDHRDRLRDQWSGAADRLGPVYDAMVDLPHALGGERLARPNATRGVFISDGRALEDLAAVSLVLEAARSSGRTGLKLY